MSELELDPKTVYYSVKDIRNFARQFNIPNRSKIDNYELLEKVKELISKNEEFYKIAKDYFVQKEKTKAENKTKCKEKRIENAELDLSQFIGRY
jgi:hypothetical protein